MKKIILPILFLLSYTICLKAQTDSLAGFDMAEFNVHYAGVKDAAAKARSLVNVQRNYIRRKFNLQEPVGTYFKTDSTAGCGNLDFEAGNTSGWTVTGDFQLMSGSALDGFGIFPVVCPGGNYSLRLNDNNTTSKTNFASSAIRTITITSADPNVKVDFAACFLNFPHPANAASFAKIEFFDQFNNPIPTQSLSLYYANPPGSFFGTSTYFLSTAMGVNIGSQSYNVACVPWQSRTFNLSAYIGQAVTIKLSANWCLYNYDWGYAYFDVCCTSNCPNPPYIGNGNFCTPFPYTLCAPSNMQNYNWTGPGGAMGTNTCIPVNNPGTYSVTYTSMTSTVTQTSVYIFNAAPTASFTVSGSYCSTTNSVALSGNPSGGAFSGPGVTGNNFDPSSVGPGTYTIDYTYTNPTTSCTTIYSQTTAVSVCSGVASLGDDALASVWPNPFSEEIKLNATGNSTFVLYNSLGQEVLRRRLEKGLNTIHVGTLSRGIYTYSLNNEDQSSKRGKLLKE